MCLPLCSYDANMTDIKLLAGVCGKEFHKLLRCGAGGRNHASCCTRRGVSPACLSLCSGVMVNSLIETAVTCIPYIGNIAQCFEEGTGILPGPISELHATVIDQHAILLEWEAPIATNTTIDYVVHYQKVDNTSMHETMLKLDHVSFFIIITISLGYFFQQMNVSSTTATITDLEANSTYQVFVVARNQHGTSLPSSIIVIKLVKTGLGYFKSHFRFNNSIF